MVYGNGDVNFHGLPPKLTLPELSICVCVCVCVCVSCLFCFLEMPQNSVLLLVWLLLLQRSPTFLASGTGFVEENFSTDGVRGQEAELIVPVVSTDGGGGRLRTPVLLDSFILCELIACSFYHWLTFHCMDVAPFVQFTGWRAIWLLLVLGDYE